MNNPSVLIKKLTGKLITDDIPWRQDPSVPVKTDIGLKKSDNFPPLFILDFSRTT